MTDPAKQITDLSKYVNQYYKTKGILQDGEKLSMLLQKITGLLFYLETVRCEIHDLYENEVYNLVKEGNSVARAVNAANVKYPTMYQLRHVMSSGYKIVEALRTNISFLKSERQNSNQ